VKKGVKKGDRIVKTGDSPLFFEGCRGLIHQTHLQDTIMEIGLRIERQKLRPDLI
jgi:hypothetical protein